MTDLMPVLSIDLFIFSRRTLSWPWLSGTSIKSSYASSSRRRLKMFFTLLLTSVGIKKQGFGIDAGFSILEGSHPYML